MQERAEERGAQQHKVAGAAGVPTEFGVFAPSNVAAVVVGAFDRPMTADAGGPTAGARSMRGECSLAARNFVGSRGGHLHAREIEEGGGG